MFGERHPGEMHEWMSSLRRLLEELSPESDRESRHRAGPCARALFIFNGLWEAAGRNAEALARKSHMQLIAAVTKDLCSVGIEVHLADVRHPARLALFDTPPRVVHARPWTDGSLAVEARNGYLRTMAALLGNRVDNYHVDVIEPAEDGMIAGLMRSAHEYLVSLRLSRHDVVIVSGGIFAPYFIEPLLPSTPANRFLYAMSYRNSSLRPECYEAVLTPIPSLQVMPGIEAVPRPGALSSVQIPGMETWDSTLPLLPASSQDNSTRILAVGLNVGARIGKEYVDLLTGVASEVGALELVIIGRPNGVAPLLREEMAANGIRIREIGVVEDLPSAIRAYSGTATVAVNPRHSGNGGCLIQASYCGIPVAVFAGNDAEQALPRECFFDDRSELQRAVVGLLRDGQARSAARQKASDVRNTHEVESRRIIERLVSWES